MKKWIILFNFVVIISYAYCLDDFDLYLGFYSNKSFQLMEITKENNRYIIKDDNSEDARYFPIKFYYKENNVCFSIDTTSDEVGDKDYKFQKSNDSKNITISTLNNSDVFGYKINSNLSKDELINSYKKFSDLINKSGYFLDQNNRFLYYIFSDYPEIKIIRYKLDEFIIKGKDESTIYFKNNNLYTNFDNKEGLIIITYDILKISENIANNFSNKFSKNYDQKKYGNNLVIAKYIYKEFTNKQFNNFTEDINEEFYKKSFIIITIFGTFLFKSNNPNFKLESNKNFINIPFFSQIEEISINDYFWFGNIDKNMNFPENIILEFSKYNKIDILATGKYIFEVEYSRIY